MGSSLELVAEGRKEEEIVKDDYIEQLTHSIKKFESLSPQERFNYLVDRGIINENGEVVLRGPLFIRERF